MNDQQLDNLMRQIANDAALDEASVDEIANSPSLWWSVRREIRKAPKVAPWPPSILKRFLIVGLPAAAAILIGLGLYLNNAPNKTGDTADVKMPAASNDIGLKTAATETRTQTAITAITPSPRVARPIKALVNPQTITPTRAALAKTAKPSAEIKSDFIALAYARDPESGQLVRVKVPSSMMVTLGLVSHVEKPSDLVDAEVIVGDDGLTRAIRFIRQ
ncbi:MAG TPA: hypothetical protein VGO43_09475 [Pyrinomonadaceae bacterium]|jgi:hypothetical protein|nr:hypothetical protein [Pyrinomonadaceae bacterium]